MARVTVPAHAHTAGREWAGGRAANTNPPRDARDALAPSSPPPSAAVWPTSPADSAARPRHAQHPPWSPAGGPALEQARAMARVRPARGLDASPSLRRGGGGWGRGRGARPLYSHTHGRARRERKGGEWKNKKHSQSRAKKKNGRPPFCRPRRLQGPAPPPPSLPRAPPKREASPLARSDTHCRSHPHIATLWAGSSVPTQTCRPRHTATARRCPPSCAPCLPWTPCWTRCWPRSGRVRGRWGACWWGEKRRGLRRRSGKGGARRALPRPPPPFPSRPPPPLPPLRTRPSPLTTPYAQPCATLYFYPFGAGAFTAAHASLHITTTCTRRAHAPQSVPAAARTTVARCPAAAHVLYWQRARAQWVVCIYLPPPRKFFIFLFKCAPSLFLS